MTSYWDFRKPAPLQGRIELPGDKSVSHRAFLLNALGEGEVVVRGANEGADVASTRQGLRALGLSIHGCDDGSWRVKGRGGHLRPASDAVDCGNSGTTLRLLAGILAAQPFSSCLDGDESLRHRPMGRIAKPLRLMGARVDGPDGGRTPPLIVTGGSLRAIHYELPVASAQVKSCLLLAGVGAGVEVDLREPGSSRDHTERMLLAMGAKLQRHDGRVRLLSADALRCVDVEVPGDPSSAALLAAAAAVVPGSQIHCSRVLLNPTRLGFVKALQGLGVDCAVQVQGSSAGEEFGKLRVKAPASLLAVELSAQEIPTLIDEIPALAAVAAFAQGVSRFRGVGELRVKESDRLAAVRHLLGDFGVHSEEQGDDLVIHGGEPVAPAQLKPAEDHRMVMAAAALALGALARGSGARCQVAERGLSAVSYPGFRSALQLLSPGSVE